LPINLFRDAVMNESPPVKYRTTKQKRMILEVLKSTNTHPTADWVYEKVRKKIPSISIGTVYRNLNILKSQGQILELNFGKGFSRYDGTPDNHYHFTCEECGRVLDVDVPLAHELDGKVEDSMRVTVNKHRLEFYGVCEECSASRK
jgi:Fur family transcriptional regulator, peroxide stress response regulator